jgi:hypothetical protein
VWSFLAEVIDDGETLESSIRKCPIVNEVHAPDLVGLPADAKYFALEAVATFALFESQ